jgi:DNA mismatch repair protein MutL
VETLVEQPRILQLDELTIGHIAAGEVVERPAQVVKELVENSIDANATRIEITVERGGFDLIRVDDDGHGIVPDDLSLALDRHATSKLARKEDLSAIHTMGFRGEALASIGVVSHLTLTSRCEGAEGAEVRMVEGKRSPVASRGRGRGTTVNVEHLFGNVPARLAFQRRPQTEHARIVDVVVDHAMAHHHVGFRLELDGRVALDVPPVDEVEDRLHDLLGQRAGELLPLTSPLEDEEAPGTERWSGWISAPDITRGKADDVHVLVNGRPVAAGPFLQAVRRGYRTRLMVGRHPVAVLQLNLPAEEVDVNVHPTKREVRLRHAWRVLERLERAVAYTLQTVATQPESAGAIPELSGLDRSQQAVLPVDVEVIAEPPAWARAAGIGRAVERATEPQQEVRGSAPIQASLPGMDPDPIAPALSAAERDLHRHAGARTLGPTEETALEGAVNDLPPMEPIGQFAGTYMLVEAGEELLLIDQHALHERIRYERLRHDEALWEGQRRLVPIPLLLDARTIERVLAGSERLASIGFELQLIEHQWCITAAPRLLEDDVEAFLLDLLQDVDEDGAPLETVERRRDHLAFMTACRGAVKANQPLNRAEMRRLLEDMRRIPNPWACVHGRPTALRLDRQALDLHFGREG